MRRSTVLSLFTESRLFARSWQDKMAYMNQSLESSPQIDRWHYLDFRSESHDENYIEWIYFNFVQEDLAGYFLYYLLDPEKRTKLGGGRLLARIFKKDGS